MLNRVIYLAYNGRMYKVMGEKYEKRKEVYFSTISKG